MCIHIVYMYIYLCNAYIYIYMYICFYIYQCKMDYDKLLKSAMS